MTDVPARLQLLALRSIAYAGDTRPGGYVVLPDQAVVSETDAAFRIREMHKPLTCSVEDRGGIAIVASDQVGPEMTWQVQRRRRNVERREAMIGSLAVPSREMEREILAVGRGSDTLLVSFAELIEWYCDYLTSPLVDLAHHRPSSAEQAEGIRAILRVSPGTSVHFEF